MLATLADMDFHGHMRVVPPPVIADALRQLTRIEAFQVLKALQEDEGQAHP